MRWNCPHCGVNLGVADEKLGSGWSFSRCYKCGGFALIRKAEVNLIKVDKAPVGENVLLPEATDTPVLSNQATQNLEKLLAEKPAIRPPNRRPPAFNDNANTNVNVANGATNKGSYPINAKKADAAANPFAALPDPLPDPEKPSYFRMLPAAIGLAGVLTVSSGIYLYIQGQALWKTARAKAANTSTVANANRNTNVSRVDVTAPATNTTITANQPAKLDSAPVVIDTVQQNLMAPVRNTEVRNENLIVRIRNENTKLRSGPGTKFPIVGVADNQVRYEVIGWKDDWFKVAPIRAARAVANANEFEISSWIRNDLVEPVGNSPSP